MVVFPLIVNELLTVTSLLFTAKKELNLSFSTTHKKTEAIPNNNPRMPIVSTYGLTLDRGVSSKFRGCLPDICIETQFPYISSHNWTILKNETFIVHYSILPRIIGFCR